MKKWYLYTINVLLDILKKHCLDSKIFDLFVVNNDGIYFKDEIFLSLNELYAVYLSLSLGLMVDEITINNEDYCSLKDGFDGPWINALIYKKLRSFPLIFNGINNDTCFKVIITHDIDRTTSLEPIAITNAFMHIVGFRKLPCISANSVLKKNEIMRYIEKMLIYECDNDIDSIYFMMSGPYSGRRFGTRTDIEWKVSKQIGSLIKDSGRIIGLHGSYGASDYNTYSLEKKRIEDILCVKINSHRNHYLRFNIEKFPDQIQKAGIEYDFSIGYNDNIGFRAGIAMPFSMYDACNECRSAVKSVPLLFMDTAIMGRVPMDYMGEIKKRLLDVKRVGGCVSLLFHPEVMIIDYRFWELYENIIQLCIDLGADLKLQKNNNYIML